jgi:hypothetical protein
MSYLLDTTPGLAGVSAYTLHSQLGFSSWMNLIIGVVAFVAVLLPSILFTRTIDQSDIESLRQMLASLGLINRMLAPAINLAEKLLKLTNKSGAKPSPSPIVKENPL